LAAYEGLLAQVVYIFDDAVVFVHPPRGVATADFVRLVTTNLGAIHGPSFTGETITQSLAKGYLNDKKFAHIAEFSSQFGDLGFRDPRATSALLADQLDRTDRSRRTESSPSCRMSTTWTPAQRFRHHALWPPPGL